MAPSLGRAEETVLRIIIDAPRSSGALAQPTSRRPIKGPAEGRMGSCRGRPFLRRSPPVTPLAVFPPRSQSLAASAFDS